MQTPVSPLENLLLKPSSAHLNAMDLADVSIKSFLSVKGVVRSELSKVDGFENTEGILFRSLENLLGRIEEQAEGMLVAFSCGCAASAETIARTVVETSVNFIFITRGDRGKRLTSFFRTYLKDHSKRLSEWREYVVHNTPERSDILAMIDGRKDGAAHLQSFVEAIASELSLPDEPSSYDWPQKLLERFKAVDHIDSYWTIYHRLSGATHGNAEDTIRWLMGLHHLLVTGERKHFEAMASETVHYTALMLCIAIRYYIEACIQMCVIYEKMSQIETLKQIYHQLGERIVELSDDAGVPNPSGLAK